MTPSRAVGLVGIGFVLLACQAQATPTSTPATPMSSASAAVTAGPSEQASVVARTCRGPDVDWSALPLVAQAYGKAWNERDPATRLRLLEEAWAETGSYADPTMEGPVAGREAFADHIGGFLDGRLRQYFEPSEWIASDEHHGYLQMRWRFCSPDGEVLLDGVDFGELGSDGRLARATGFFALEPEQPRAICAPPAGDWSGIPEIARKWAATTVSDPTTRMALLREVFAAGGSYVDPSDQEPVAGYDALDERVAGMLWEGAFFEPSAWTAGDSHHDYMRLRWRLCDKNDPGLEGTDYVELNDTGRFLRVIGFFEWP